LYEIAAREAERLVLDFRGNTGGFISAFAAAFLPLMSNWSLIEESMNGNKTKLACTPEKFTVQYGYPEDVIIESHLHYQFRSLKFDTIYCLIDRESYSCGEIFPLLLKDICGAVLHGETSGGAISSYVTARVHFSKINHLTYPGDRILDLGDTRQVIVDIEGMPDDIWPIHRVEPKAIKKKHKLTTDNSS
jgi:C-terminal processing protease CtpA/Prc